MNAWKELLAIAETPDQFAKIQDWVRRRMRLYEVVDVFPKEALEHVQHITDAMRAKLAAHITKNVMVETIRLEAANRPDAIRARAQVSVVIE